MTLFWRDLGELLSHQAANCSRHALLVSPFAKYAPLQKIIAALPASVHLTFVTRWRLEELASGVSDLECWRLIDSRPDSVFRLLPNLHAKYFRFDDEVFVGSANLTAKGLGWTTHSNLELLFAVTLSQECKLEFERQLLAGSVQADINLYTQFHSDLGFFTSRENASCETSLDVEIQNVGAVHRNQHWVPTSRSPEAVFDAYRGILSTISSSGIAAVISDLAELDIPAGLHEHAFRSVVTSRLMALPVVVALDGFLERPRRFGEIRDWMTREFSFSNSTDAWQQLMRWLLYFLPNRYEMKASYYSEIFSRK